MKLPFSKSMFMRAAAITALRNPLGLRSLSPMADCDDSRRFLDALTALLDAPEGHLIRVDIGEGAAPLRIFTALAASMPGKVVRVDGAEGLKRRPVAPLVNALRMAGADIDFVNRDERLPLLIHGRKLDGDGVDLNTIDISHTSQYLTALMLASPLWDNPIPADKITPKVSSPYFRMTLAMIKEDRPVVEHDWSAASFFYEMLLARAVRSEAYQTLEMRLSPLAPPSRSLQGDSAVCEIFKELGVKTEFTPECTVISADPRDIGAIADSNYTFRRDMRDTPDLVPPVVVALACCCIPFSITGVGHLRFKESDRLESLRCELEKVGYKLRVGKDSIDFDGHRYFKPAPDTLLDSHSDHRMAMALAPLILSDGVRIKDPGVVSKSFPNFWNQLKL